MNRSAELPSPMSLATPQHRASRPAGVQPRPTRASYLSVLTWAFTLFGTLRVVSYLPTMWAIQASADSSHHSLWTWFTWLGANATLAAWLYEQNGRRLTHFVLVNIGNAGMCAMTVTLIVLHRSWI